MTQLPDILPALVCPVGMGAMMCAHLRGRGEATAADSGGLVPSSLVSGLWCLAGGFGSDARTLPGWKPLHGCCIRDAHQAYSGL